MWRRLRASLVAVCGALLAAGAALAGPPSVPDAAAPALAALGPHAVGRVVLDYPLAAEGPSGSRRLAALVWYPARAVRSEAPSIRGELPPGPGRTRPTPYAAPAISHPGAAPVAGQFPLVVLSHGYGNAPDWMSWLGENLASKGYVVVAPAHRDPPYIGPQSLAEPLNFRPRDQARAARETPGVLAALGGGWAGLVDPSRIAIVGYSMGGYGALRSAGAATDPAGATAALLPAGTLGQASPPLPGLRALVAIAPWGGQANISAFDRGSLGRMTTPIFFLAGEHDDVSGYADGVATLYEAMTSAPRWMLTFQAAGHTIGLGPVPAEAADWLPAREMFEDPIWAKARVNAVAQHTITAFLDLHLKGMADRRALLDVGPDIRRKTWPGYAARWANGLTLRRDTADGR